MIELSMLLWKKQPLWVQTFTDFFKVLYKEIMNISSLFNRWDFITDQYFERSLKGTREDRGSGTELIVTFDDCSGFPPNFISKFLTNATNKRNLNKYLANKFLAYYEGKQSILCVTFGDSIISKWINFVRNWNKPMQQWRDRSKDWCYKPQKERIYQCTSKKQLIVT